MSPASRENVRQVAAWTLGSAAFLAAFVVVGKWLSSDGQDVLGADYDNVNGAAVVGCAICGGISGALVFWLTMLAGAKLASRPEPARCDNCLGKLPRPPYEVEHMRFCREECFKIWSTGFNVTTDGGGRVRATRKVQGRVEEAP